MPDDQRTRLFNAVVVPGAARIRAYRAHAVRRVSMLFLVLAVASCSMPTGPDLTALPTVHSLGIVGDLALSAAARIQSDSVFVEVFAENAGTTEGRLELGYCTFGIVGSSGRRSWDNSLTARNCPDVGISISVPSNESRRVFLFARSFTQLRPSDDARSYTVTVYYRKEDGRVHQLSAGRITF